MTLYDVLGVQQDASPTQLKQAYRRRAKDCHPDTNKTAEANDKFQRLHQAYTTLSNPAKRRAYDRQIDSGASGDYVAGYDENYVPAYAEDNTGPKSPTYVMAGIGLIMVPIVVVLILGGIMSQSVGITVFGLSLSVATYYGLRRLANHV